MSEAVIQLARLALRQHLVRLDDLAKALLRIRRLRDVGVKLAREPAKGAFYFAFVRRAGDAEHLVVVPLRRRHQPRLAAGQTTYSGPRHQLLS